MKKLAMTLVLGSFLVGCAGMGGSSHPVGGDVTPIATTPDAADFKGLIKQAEAANAKAKKMGHEWRDTKKFIKKAEKAMKAGDKAKAMKLAKKAKFEGEAGQYQAKNEKAAGPWLF